MPKRPRPVRRNRQSAEADELIRMAHALANSSNLAEDHFWQTSLSKSVDELLLDGDESTLNTALDALAKVDVSAWNELADIIESCSETYTYQHNGIEWQAFLIAAPILSWSRYNIPSGPLGRGTSQLLKQHLSAYVFAENSKMAIADYLFSPDQLTQNFCKTRALTESLAHLAQENGTFSIDSQQLPETKPFLSDTRFILAVVTAPRGAPFMRWQEEDTQREEVESLWRKHSNTPLQPIFTGCAFEGLLPQAYFAAWREADRASRAYSIRATTAFLQLVFNIEPRKIRAVIAPFHARRLEEFRIGFMLNSGNQVIHGVVWALLDGEDEQTESTEEIENILRECGVREIVIHEHAFPLDYCDDCGAPYFPNPEGELVHTEMPDSHEDKTQQLH